MKLYEPIVGAFLLITVLIIAFSGALAKAFVSDYERDCHKSNVQLLENNMEGPLKPCQVHS